MAPSCQKKPRTHAALVRLVQACCSRLDDLVCADLNLIEDLTFWNAPSVIGMLARATMSKARRQSEDLGQRAHHRHHSTLQPSLRLQAHHKQPLQKGKLIEHQKLGLQLSASKRSTEAMLVNDQGSAFAMAILPTALPTTTCPADECMNCSNLLWKLLKHASSLFEGYCVMPGKEEGAPAELQTFNVQPLIQNVTMTLAMRGVRNAILKMDGSECCIWQALHVEHVCLTLQMIDLNAHLLACVAASSCCQEPRLALKHD